MFLSLEVSTKDAPERAKVVSLAPDNTGLRELQPKTDGQSSEPHSKFEKIVTESIHVLKMQRPAGTPADIPPGIQVIQRREA